MSTSYRSKAKYNTFNQGKSKCHPKENANIVSKLFFWWCLPLLQTGNKQRLNLDDIWKLEKDNTCEEVTTPFYRAYSKSHSILKAFLARYGGFHVLQDFY